MGAASVRGVGDMPPSSMGTEWPGIGMSLLVHGLLLAALAWGVRWQSASPAPVSAELWAAVPQAATQPPSVEAAPAPPPPRVERRLPVTAEREADIALEKARKDKAEQERLRQRQVTRDRVEKERREQAEKAAQAERDANARLQAQARETAAAEQREAKQREENLARMMGQLGGTGSNAAKAGGAAGSPSASYAGLIVAAIKPNVVFAENLPGNPAAEVEVRAGPGGTIIGRTLLRSSGHPEWDEAVLRAIDRTGSLPKDVDGRVPPRLTITFRPRD